MRCSPVTSPAYVRSIQTAITELAGCHGVLETSTVPKGTSSFLSASSSGLLDAEALVCVRIDTHSFGLPLHSGDHLIQHRLMQRHKDTDTNTEIQTQTDTDRDTETQTNRQTHTCRGTLVNICTMHLLLIDTKDCITIRSFVAVPTFAFLVGLVVA